MKSQPAWLTSFAIGPRRTFAGLCATYPFEPSVRIPLNILCGSQAYLMSLIGFSRNEIDVSSERVGSNLHLPS
jgi:hypothetical protein